MSFDYYYGLSSEQYSFYRIPKSLMFGDDFRELSLQAKLLYGLLLDRMGMSARNQWVDDSNRVYVVYQISEIQEDMNVSKRKAIEYLKELEAVGLVTKKVRKLVSISKQSVCCSLPILMCYHFQKEFRLRLFLIWIQQLKICFLRKKMRNQLFI